MALTNATKSELLRAIAVLVGIVIVITIVGYVLTGNIEAGIGAGVGVVAISYALYTLRNLLNWGAGS